MDEVKRLRDEMEGLQRRVVENRRSEDRFRAALELAPDGIVIADSQGRIVLANQQVSALFGYAAAELEGSTIDILVPQRLRGGHAHHRERFMADPATRPMGTGLDLAGQRKDGSEFPVEISLSPLCHEDGVFVMAVIRDMTAHRAIEARLRDESATRKSDERFRLMLENASDLLLVLGDDGRVHYASPATERVLEVPAGDLSGTMLVDRMHPEDRSRFDSLWKGSLEARNALPAVEIRLRSRDGTWRVLDARATNLVDSPGIEGVVLSLRDVTERKSYEAQLLQAQKMESIGRLAGGVAHDFNNLLTLESRRVDIDGDSADALPGLAPGTHVRIAVRDTGVGMDLATQAHLFEPFFTTKDVGKGTGLGLATCYAIVKQAGGHIVVRSEAGHGTTMTVFLPAAREGEPEVVAPVAVGESAGGTETVLVVEDEPSLRTLVARILADQGYTVLAAGTGEQALELADAFEGNIDLVVTDVVMPGVGGQSLARMLHARRPATRFLLMSGYAPNGPGPDGGAEPGWAFLQKPFTARILARKVRETLDVTAG